MNINQNIIREYLLDILKKSEIKSKIINLPTPNHGSSNGENVDVELFWDELNHEWETKDIAYQNYIISKLKPIINEVIKNGK